MKKKTKRKIFNLIAILVVLSGLVVLLYPIISNYMYQKNQQKLQEYYNNQVHEIADRELDSMWQDCWDYNEDLQDHMVKLTDPFEQDRLSHAVHPYIDLLNPDGDGIMGSLEIPAINCRLMIYHNTDDDVLSKGIGHLQGSSLPVGGKGSHSVLTGHTGSASRELFTNLDQLKLGDVFYLHILGETLCYQVDQILVVIPEDTSELAIDRDEDYVTLVTCTPYGINSHRLLVRGTRIPYEAAKTIEEERGTSGSTWWKQYFYAIMVGVALFIIIVMVIVIINKLTKKKKSKKQKEAVDKENVKKEDGGAKDDEKETGV